MCSYGGYNGTFNVASPCHSIISWKNGIMVPWIWNTRKINRQKTLVPVGITEKLISKKHHVDTLKWIINTKSHPYYIINHLSLWRMLLGLNESFLLSSYFYHLSCHYNACVMYFVICYWQCTVYVLFAFYLWRNLSRLRAIFNFKK
jgi:hypothetical protein